MVITILAYEDITFKA